jgi:hypothetical protein
VIKFDRDLAVKTSTILELVIAIGDPEKVQQNEWSFRLAFHVKRA